MLQILKKISESVLDPIGSISTLAKAVLQQHDRIVELEGRVERLSRVVLFNCMQNVTVNRATALPALKSDMPVDLTITMKDGEELSFTIKILQGESESKQKQERPLSFGRPGPSKSRPRE